MSCDHIFLVGFMGAGKSTVAEILAAELGRACVDLDSEVVRRAGRSVNEIFNSEGEDAFRLLESQALLDVESMPPSVVACGGGIVVRPENRAALKTMGTVVYLRVTAGEALARIGDAGTRPLLAGGSGTLAATTLLAARESLYRSVADVVVETVGRDAGQVAHEVLTVLGGSSS